MRKGTTQFANHRTSPAAQGTQSAAGSCFPRRARHIAEYELEEDLGLYAPLRDTARILNPTAALVWWLCDGEQAPEDISARLVRLFTLKPAQVRQDVEEKSPS